MKTLVALASITLLPLPARAAPALADKPPRWEYAELSYRSTSGRPGGFDPDGTEVPAIPSTVTVHWVTKEGEVEVKGWAELAEKLKAKGFKKEGSAAYQKIQMLNILGEEGWELMEQGGSPVSVPAARGDRGGGGPGGFGLGRSSATAWLLKRRVP
jgi:hypothetical protein